MSPPAWWPRRLYYGWALVGTLGLTATASYGVLTYAFAVFIEPMTRELGWSQATVTGAFSLGSLVAGAAAIPVGRLVDDHGARWVMTGGSVVAALGLWTWSQVQSVAAFYLLWLVLGVAMAAVLYEPAFAVVAAWFKGHRGRALTLLTFMGGFASVVFVPLATWLVLTYGWRGALVRMALLYAGLTILPHAVVLRRRPSDLGLGPDGAADVPPMGSTETAERWLDAATAIRAPSFRWLAAAFSLSALTTTAISVHLVPLLLGRGHAPAFAAAAMALLGLMALPGRLIVTPLGGAGRWPRAYVIGGVFFIQAAACAVLVGWDRPAAVWVFGALFGAGSGAITPARAALVAEWYGSPHYGRIAGALALPVAVSRGVAPVGASWILAAGGGGSAGYDWVVMALGGICLAAGAAVFTASVRGRPVRRRDPAGQWDRDHSGGFGSQDIFGRSSRIDLGPIPRRNRRKA